MLIVEVEAHAVRTGQTVSVARYHDSAIPMPVRNTFSCCCGHALASRVNSE